MKRYFCTYFDINYLDRGIVLYRSLEQHVPEFKLFVLCLDDDVHHALTELDLENIHLIPLASLEASDPMLLGAKANRSRIEYYFTCTPALPKFILGNFPAVKMITYLDADLFFFSTPEPLFEEIGDSSVAIIGHRFPDYLKVRCEQAGVFNVGWLSFKRDTNAMKCLSWWRARCLEWCFDRVEDGKFADQKYLDGWPDLFKGVKVLEYKGANVAPWNLANYTVTFHSNKVWIDNQQLIFFHFHGLKRVGWTICNPKFWHYGLDIHKMPNVKKHIVEPYMRAIRQFAAPIIVNLRTKDMRLWGLRDQRHIFTQIGSLILAIFRRQLIIC